MENVIDCVVVGAGVGGLAAGLFLGRAGRSTLIFNGGRPTIMVVETVREYLGFDGMTPDEMLEKASNEVRRYGVEILNAKVEKIIPLDNGWFNVIYPGGQVTSRSVVLATGETYELPDISGIPEIWGRDLRVCPCFDGNEVRNGKYVVFGVGGKLAHMASWVSMWSDDITIVSEHEFSEEETQRLSLLDIKIVRDEIAGLVHEGKTLTSVTTKNGDIIPCDATWVSLNARATSELASTLCNVDKLGFALTDASGATSRPGVYAIGNAAQPWDHLAHAAAAGTRVGPVVTSYLLEQKIAERKRVRIQNNGALIE